MPTARIAYVDQPLVMPRYTPDYSRLSALYTQGGDTLARLALQRGAATAATFDRLGALFSGFQQAQQQQRAAAAALAQRAADREDEQAFTLQRDAAQEAARATERKTEAEIRKGERDADAKVRAEEKAEAAVSADIDKAPRGIVSPALLQAAQKFPNQAARFVMQDGVNVLPMTGAEKQAYDREKAAATDRKADNERADKMLKISQQNADTASRNASKSSASFAGDFNLTGQAFLDTIPAQHRQTVKKIAAYEEDPTKVASMRGNNREQIMAWVNQVNPGYKADEFSNRAPTRKAYTTGTQGQQINAINTALGHIDQLDTLVTALGNKSFVPGNQLANWASKTFGSSRVTNFDTLKDALSAEVASVLSKGQATVSEIAEQRQKINAASSPEQLVGYIKTQIPIMGSKLASLDYQYHQAMGPDDDFSALSPLSKSILEKHGFDYTAHASSAQAEAKTAAPAIKVLSITPVKKP